MTRFIIIVRSINSFKNEIQLYLFENEEFTKKKNRLQLFSDDTGKKRLYLKLQNTNWLLKSLPV